MTTDGRVGAFPDQDPADRHQYDRCRRRQHRGGRTGGLPDGRSTLGGRGSGPGCYGRGGVEPTMTDANVVLGRLGTERPLGGEIAPRPRRRARRGRTLGWRDGSAWRRAMAEGILRIAAVSLAGAIKEVSVMRGIDPRDFALLSFGGAGPLHAAAIADELGMRTVVVPPMPGNFSAFGLLIADVRRDFVRTRVSPRPATLSVEQMSGPCLQELLARRRAASWRRPASRRPGGASPPASTCGMPASRSSCPFPVDMDVAEHGGDRAGLRRGLRGALWRARPTAPSRSSAIAWRPGGCPTSRCCRRSTAAGRTLAAAVVGTRTTVFDGEPHAVPVVDRERLPPGRAVTGPALDRGERVPRPSCRRAGRSSSTGSAASFCAARSGASNEPSIRSPSRS